MATSKYLWPVLLMAAFSMMSYFDRTILSVASPRIIQEFHLTETQMGWVYFAFQASYTMLMTHGGMWADRFGPRRVLTVSTLGAGALTAAFPLAAFGALPALLLVRFGFGALTAPLYPSTGSLNAAWVPADRRSRAQGAINAGAGMGGAVSPLLFTWLMAMAGWRLSFVAAGVATILLAMVWHFTTRHLSEPSQKRYSQGVANGPQWRRLFESRNLMLLTLGYFGIDYFEYIFFYWLYYYLSEVRHLPSTQTAVYTSLPFVAWVLMMPLGGYLCDLAAVRIGTHRAVRLVGIAGIAVSVVLLIAALQSADILTTVILLSVAFGSCAISDVVSWTAVISIAGKNAGTYCGIMNTGGNLGGMIAPVLTPWIASQYGWSAGLYFGGAVVSIAFVTWLLFREEAAPPIP